jgi:arsenate reductase-like glutaredoxin family protein
MADAPVNSDRARDALEIASDSSLIDFLNIEDNCEDDLSETELFSEISRLASLSNNKLSDDKDDRTIEELLREAETLINQPIIVEHVNCTISCESTPLELRHGIVDQYDYSTIKTLSHPDVSLLSFIE